MSYLKILGTEIELPTIPASAITAPGKLIRVFNDDGAGHAAVVTILDSSDQIKASFRIAHHTNELIKVDQTDKLYASHNGIWILNVAYPGG